VVRQRMYVVIVGHVDHGKSTIIGRLLADTGSLPEGKLEQVKALCERTDKPFEYAFLLDALKDERAQGITIDAARVFFKSDLRDYVILDAPGHSEFLKNMITGAARAEAALLVIDAAEGVKENSRRHGTMLSLLGIRQVAVIVNKMDLVAFQKEVFDAVSEEYAAFLERLGVVAACFVPASGRGGDNIAARSDKTPWYAGPTVLDVLDRFVPASAAVDGPLRLPVQDVYKFTGHGDDRRIVAGTIVSGKITVGDEVLFFPSAKKSRVQSIERFAAASSPEAAAGDATGITLTEQIYVSRGELMTRAADPAPAVSTRFAASLFWLGRSPLVKNKDYVLKLGTGRQKMRIEEVSSVMDASTLGSTKRGQVDRHEVADCILSLARPLAFDVSADVAETSRFVIIDDYEIRGGGIIRQALPDREAWLRERVLVRNAKWEPSAIGADRRIARFGQRPTLLLLTGDTTGERRKSFARELETRLFEAGRLVYFLGIGNVLYGVDADLERKPEMRGEHVRRLAEIAHIMLDAGFLLVVTAAELTPDEIAIVKTTVPAELIETVWLGASTPPPEMAASMVIAEDEEQADAVRRVTGFLEDRGITYRAW
jgi:bifunctional enzyme CysN/CysC